MYDTLHIFKIFLLPSIEKDKIDYKICILMSLCMNGKLSRIWTFISELFSNFSYFHWIHIISNKEKFTYLKKNKYHKSNWLLKNAIVLNFSEKALY